MSFLTTVDGLLQKGIDVYQSDRVAANDADLAAARASSDANQVWAERLYQSDVNREAALNQVKADGIKYGSIAVLALVGIYVLKRAGVF